MYVSKFRGSNIMSTMLGWVLQGLRFGASSRV